MDILLKKFNFIRNEIESIPAAGTSPESPGGPAEGQDPDGGEGTTEETQDDS